MPKVLLGIFVGLLVVGVGLFIFSLVIPEKGNEGYWTSFLLHGVAESWGFAFGIFATFAITLNLANERIQPIVKFIAKLRRDKVIKGETARGIIMCATKLISEEKLTENLTTSIKAKEEGCDICGLQVSSRVDKRCEYCGLQNHLWQLPKEGL